MRKEVTLQFPSLQALYLFCAKTQLDSFELNSRTFLLTGTCSEEEITQAVARYNATLISSRDATIGQVYK